MSRDTFLLVKTVINSPVLTSLLVKTVIKVAGLGATFSQNCRRSRGAGAPRRLRRSDPPGPSSRCLFWTLFSENNDSFLTVLSLLAETARYPGCRSALWAF